MRQREGHFLHLAQETAVLKDQVDALRELSVMVLKDESSHQQRSFPPSALVLESPVRSHSNISFKSEENNLEKEIDAIAMQQQELEVTKEKLEDEVSNKSVESANEKNKESTELMVSSSPKSSVKVSGTLKLMKPFEVQKNYKKFEDEDYGDYGCFPKFLAAIWSTIFD